jgi:hypothetical protein
MHSLATDELLLIASFVDCPSDYCRLRNTGSNSRNSLGQSMEVSLEEYEPLVRALRTQRYARKVRINRWSRVNETLVVSLLRHFYSENSARGCDFGCVYSDALEEYLTHIFNCTGWMSFTESSLSFLLVWSIEFASSDCCITILRCIRVLEPITLAECLNAFQKRIKPNGKRILAKLVTRVEAEIFSLPISMFYTLQSPIIKALISRGFPVDRVPLEAILCSRNELNPKQLEIMLSSHPGWADIRGSTKACREAAINGDLDRLKVLLRIGAAIDPIDCLINSGSISIVKYLVNDLKVNPNLRKGNTCLLSSAAASGDKCFLREILKIGVEVSGDNSKLALEASMGNKDMTELLLSKGSDINSMLNDRKESLLHICCSKKNVPCDYIRFLIKRGANVNAIDIFGVTPLMVSVESNRLEATKILTKEGAILDLVNIEGDTAFTIAESHGYYEHMRLLSCHLAVAKPRKRMRCLGHC